MRKALKKLIETVTLFAVYSFMLHENLRISFIHNVFHDGNKGNTKWHECYPLIFVFKKKTVYRWLDNESSHCLEFWVMAQNFSAKLSAVGSALLDMRRKLFVDVACVDLSKKIGSKASPVSTEPPVKLLDYLQ